MVDFEQRSTIAACSSVYPAKPRSRVKAIRRWKTSACRALRTGLATSTANDGVDTLTSFPGRHRQPFRLKERTVESRTQRSGTGSHMNDAVIVDVVRTASGKGKPGGAFSDTHPTDLLAHVLRALLDRNGLDSAQVDDVLVGCVSQTGEQSGNVARNALLAAGFDESVPGVSIDRQCGSSQQAAHFAAQ